jgi:hypothetical protein
MLCLTDEELAEPAVHGERRNALTDLEASDSIGDGVNDAGDLVTGNEWYWISRFDALDADAEP